MNKINRNKLLKENQSLVADIETTDYRIDTVGQRAFDLFYIATKKK